MRLSVRFLINDYPLPWVFKGDSIRSGQGHKKRPALPRFRDASPRNVIPHSSHFLTLLIRKDNSSQGIDSLPHVHSRHRYIHD